MATGKVVDKRSSALLNFQDNYACVAGSSVYVAANKEYKWWVCRVREVDSIRSRIRVVFLGSRDHGHWIALTDQRLNRSGKRETSLRCGQAGYGCTWWSKWKRKVKEAEDANQNAIVVYKKAKTGNRSTAGLGNSQIKEVEHLEKEYGYGTEMEFNQIDATEFEQENSINRAQMFAQLVSIMVHKFGAQCASLTDMRKFLMELGYKSGSEWL